MDIVIGLKSNGFMDIIYSEIEISDDYIEEETIYDKIPNEDGLYKISIKSIRYDSGQMGDFGRYEISPYYEIEKCTVKKISDIYGHITGSEKEWNREQKAKRRINNLQKFASSFSTDQKKYELSQIWSHDKLAFREKIGQSFTCYKTIHEFESDSTSHKNLKHIKDWISDYFKQSINTN